MTDEEYAALRDDIAEQGLLDPVVLYEGKVLDGRHRARACAELSVEPRTTEFTGPSAVAFVVSKNVKRRNLTTTQKAEIAVAALPEFEAEAAARQQALAGTRPTLGSDDPKVERAPRASEQVGAMVGVSGATVRRAKRVHAT